MDLGLSHGPCGTRNFTQDEILSEAKRNHYNSESYRPSFLIRIHNLTFKRVAFGGVKSKNNFQRQDLTINILRGEIYSVGQPDSFDKDEEEEGKMDEKDKSAINLLGDYSPFVSDEHFAVGRDTEDDKVWIRDLDSKQGTFVNGTMLTPQNNHKLKDGDIISLGISHLHPNCQLDKGIFWVFKCRIVPEVEKTYLNNLYSQVLGNTVILSNILTTIYDPYKKLRNVRQRLALTNLRTVSKFWDEISIPILRNKLELHFKVNQARRKSVRYKEIPINTKESMEIWNEQFRGNIAIFSSLGVRRLSIREDAFVFSPTEIRAAEAKLFEIFFGLNGKEISKIVLWFSIEPGAKKHKNREKVLQNLFRECKSAVKFKILEDCSLSLANVEASTSTTKLTIKSKISSYENLFRAFPNVFKLSLGNICLESFLHFLVDVATKEFAKEAVKHLKVFKMAPFVFRSLSQQFFIFMMTKFPIKVEEFILKTILMEENPTRHISDITSGFADSLIKLKLSFVAVQGMNKAGICFPKMEKLEKLEISMNTRNILKWSFELGGFPNLRVINFKTDWKEDAECDKNIFLESLLSAENRRYFPKLERAFISYGQLQGKNFVT